MNIKKLLLYEFVYSVCALLVLITVYTLPVVSGTVGYVGISWTWSDLDDIGIYTGFGPPFALYTFIIALIGDVLEKIKPDLSKVARIIRIISILTALWFLLATQVAVGENGPHALTGIYTYCLFYGGAFLLRYMVQEQEAKSQQL